MERVTGARCTWDGECHVHAGIRPRDIERKRAERPNAEFLIHPECGCVTQTMEYVAAGDVDSDGVHMLSTSGMLRHAHEHPDGEFIVATETGMLYPMQEAAPEAELVPANEAAVCKYMKMITLPKLRDSLRDCKHEIKVPPPVADAPACRSSAWSRSGSSGSHAYLGREAPCADRGRWLVPCSGQDYRAGASFSSAAFSGARYARFWPRYSGETK